MPTSSVFLTAQELQNFIYDTYGTGFISLQNMFLHCCRGAATDSHSINTKSDSSSFLATKKTKMKSPYGKNEVAVWDAIHSNDGQHLQAVGLPLVVFHFL